MNVIFFSSIRLFADGLISGLSGRDGISTVMVADTFSALREILASTQIDLVLVDVTHGVDLDEVHALALDYPGLVLMAIGPEEQRVEGVHHGRTAFSGYISRHTTIEELCKAMSDTVQRRLACPPESQKRSSGRFSASILSLINPFRMKASRGAKRKHGE